MKALTMLAFAMMMVSLTAIAQEDARDIAREMGADTTTSVSPGLDRNGIHRDTETVGQAQQRAPNLLDSVQGSKAKKLTEAKKKELLRKRESLREDRKTTSEAAAKKAEEATEKKGAFFLATKQVTVDEARKKAERDWDAKRGKEVQSIDRALRQSSEDGTEVRLHAPSLVNPK